MKYGINPFVETKKIMDGVWHMVSPGFSPSFMYLVEGARKALLIDTGFGVGDLKGLVGTLTRLPIEVVNTHFHGDHTNGNYQFNRVHIHADDLEACRANDRPEVRARFATPPDFTKRIQPSKAIRFPPLPDEYFTPFSANDVVPVRPYDLVGVRGGFTFDLGGGHLIEVIEIPGHTPGCIGLLDRARRILFSGDCIVYTPTFIFSGLPGTKHPMATVEGYRERLLDLRGRVGEFDGMYAGHSELNLPPAMVAEMILCCEDIMADNTLGEDFSFINAHAKVHYHGKASIAYSPDRIYKNR
jgi:glyoxylase-like metal-dependent hydrolase (beta-lactamase superfamily II)